MEVWTVCNFKTLQNCSNCAIGKEVDKIYRWNKIETPRGWIPIPVLLLTSYGNFSQTISVFFIYKMIKGFV